MAFAKYKQLTLASNSIGMSSDPTTWPLCIGRGYGPQAADTDLKDTSNGGVIRPDGFDIAFFDSVAQTTRYPAERVLYDGVNGKLEAWVNIPTLTRASATVLYMFYGDATITTDPNSGAFGKTAAWNSGYTNVYHLGDGSTLSLAGSTTTPANLTNTNSVTATTGDIAGGAHFVRTANPNAKYLSVSAVATTTFPVTLDCWAKLSDTTFADAEQRIMVALSKATGNEAFWLAYWRQASDHVTYLMVLENNVNNPKFNFYAVTVDTNWHHLAAVFTNATSLALHMDGVSISPNTSFLGAGVTPAGLDTTSIGVELETGPFQWANFNGDIDEARVSNVARSLDYNIASFQSQKASNTFITWGAATNVSGGAVIHRLAALGAGA
jgi:hypothetical protein